jgi:predicted MFS family arabinose efflux permease
MNPWRSILALPRSIWIVAAANFVNRAGTMALPFLAVYATRDLGFAPEKAGELLAFYGVGAIFASLLAGRLADRQGAARVVAASLFAAGVVLLLYPLARSFPAAAGATLALSVAGEMARPACMALVGSLAAPEQRKAAFALNRLAINLGMSIGPALGGVLATIWFPALFLIDGATAVVASAVFAVSFRGAVAPPPAPEAPADGPAPASRRAYTDGAFLYFLLAVFAFAFIMFQLDAALPLDLVRNLGLSERIFGLTFTVNTGMILALEVPLSAATARWPHRRSLALGALLYGVGFGVMAALRGVGGAFVGVVVWTFGEMISMPALSAYVADVSPPRRGGEYMGGFATAFATAFLLGPWAGTVLLTRFGPVRFWTGVLVLGVLVAAMMATVRAPPAPPEPE